MPILTAVLSAFSSWSVASISISKLMVSSGAPWAQSFGCVPSITRCPGLKPAGEDSGDVLEQNHSGYWCPCLQWRRL